MMDGVTKSLVSPGLGESVRCHGQGLFLETSAQIARLLEGKESREGVMQLCRRFERVGTSAFVLAEFEAVICGFMRSVAAALGRLRNRDGERRFDEIWHEVLGLLPAYYPGQSLASRFALAMSHRCQGSAVSPRYLENVLRAQVKLLLGRICRIGKIDMRAAKTVFDRTSCCLWMQKSPQRCVRREGAERCNLHRNCWEQRKSFEQAVRCLVGTRVSEKAVLTNKLPLLIDCVNAFSYLQTITASPNAFGDILILSEVPDHWSILTKDYAFAKLQQDQQRDIEVLKVRLPKRKVRGACQVRIDSGEPHIIKAQLENMSSRDIGLRSTERIGPCRCRIAVCVDGRWCTGYVAREQTDMDTGEFRYGVRITHVE